MSRPKLSDAKKRKKRVTVRFRSEEINELSEQAGLCGLSVSELVYRRACAQTDLLFSDPVLDSGLQTHGFGTHTAGDEHCRRSRFGGKVIYIRMSQSMTSIIPFSSLKAPPALPGGDSHILRLSLAMDIDKITLKGDEPNKEIAPVSGNYAFQLLF